MNLQERLQVWVGHDFIIHMASDVHDEEGDPISGVPMGRLQEVGDGYIIIETKSEEEGGFVGMGGEWLLVLSQVAIVLHTLGDCAGCLVDAASGTAKITK